MGVDESLARGLTTRLFAEVLQRAKDLTGKRGFLAFPHEAKRQRWSGAAAAFGARNQDLVLAHFISSSKRNPTLIASFLEAEEEADFQEWSERCLKGYTASLSFKEPFAEPSFRHFLEVSAHAVQRVLQRSSVGFVGGQFDRAGLIQELRPLANWAGFTTVLLHMFRLPQGVVLYPVIPSRHGLYLCNAMKKLGAGVSVRTFVANHQLRPEQVALRDRLLERMQWATGVPYFAVPSSGQPLIVAMGATVQVHVALLRRSFREWALALSGEEEPTASRLVNLVVGELEYVATGGDVLKELSLEGLSGYECFERFFRMAQDEQTHSSVKPT